MKVRFPKISLFEACLIILIVITPLFYFLHDWVSEAKFIKDAIIIGLGFVSLLEIINQRYIQRAFFVLIVFFVLIFLVSFVNYSDAFFYAVAMREMIVYPFLYMCIGVMAYKKGIDINKLIFYGALFCIGLMIVYAVMFPFKSFGATARFKSFFPREHLPAIYAGTLFLTSLYYTKGFFRLAIAIISFIIVMLTGTRSVLALLFLLYIMFSLKFSIKQILLLSVSCLGIYFLMSLYFTRDLFYNLEGRTTQYELAYILLKEHFFLGIGVDKYGVLGGVYKTFTYAGHSTVTMDSSFIKYFVNLGVPLTFSYLSYLFLKFWIVPLKNVSYRTMFRRLMLFAFLMGAVTGKFGAYPLNMIFFMNILMDKKQYIKLN